MSENLDLLLLPAVPGTSKCCVEEFPSIYTSVQSIINIRVLDSERKNDVHFLNIYIQQAF